MKGNKDRSSVTYFFHESMLGLCDSSFLLYELPNHRFANLLDFGLKLTPQLPVYIFSL